MQNLTWIRMKHIARHRWHWCQQHVVGVTQTPEAVYLIVYRDPRRHHLRTVYVPRWEIRDGQDHILKFGHCHSLARAKEVVVREYQKMGDN